MPEQLYPVNITPTLGTPLRAVNSGTLTFYQANTETLVIVYDENETELDNPYTITQPTSNVFLEAGVYDCLIESGTYSKTLQNIRVGGGVAADVAYSNASSGLSATNIQAALDEVEGRLSTNESLTASALQPSDNISELTNDSNFIDSDGAPVQTVNSQSGTVDLNADHIDDSATNHKFVDSDLISKVSGIEENATQDQSASEIKTAYESNADTNAYTDLDKSKLENIEAGSQVNTVDSVNGYTGTVTLSKSDLALGNVDNTSDANKPISTAQQAAFDTINALLSSDDVSLDELQEVVDYIKANRDDLDNLSINNIAGLQSALNDKIEAGANVSIFVNDSGYLTSVSEEAVTQHESALILTKSQISNFSDADYATGAEGDLAASALQNINSESIGDLSNVDLTDISSDDILQWNGSAFVAVTNSTSATQITYDNATSGLTATDTQSAIDEVESRLQTSESTLSTALQPSDNISELTNDSGYITDYTVTESDVTNHQAALSITESQISDLQDYVNTSGAQSIAGNKTFTATTSISNSNPNLILVDTDSSGSEMQGLISFQDNGSVERGYVGFDTSANTDLSIKNWLGDIVISPTGNAYIDSNQIAVHSDDISNFINDSGYLTTVSESAVTDHESALTVTKSQISDFNESDYLSASIVSSFDELPDASTNTIAFIDDTHGFREAVSDGTDWYSCPHMVSYAINRVDLNPIATFTAGTPGNWTGDSNGALTIDGLTPDPGRLVLIFTNSVMPGANAAVGVFTITEVGDASNPFVLTQFNENADYGHEILVEYGDVYENKKFYKPRYANMQKWKYSEQDYIVSSNTPSSATDAGTAGAITYDSDYIYVCTATDTWKRAALSTW